MNTSHKTKLGLLALSAALMIWAHYMVFVYVPTEAVMGIVQRIFYVMVPVAWLAMFSTFVLFIASIAYLKTRKSSWDAVAYSAAEIGLLFTTLAIVVGMLWAKPIWGVWWTWEPRLTTTLVLWLILLACLMVRKVANDPSRGSIFAAVVGIVAFIDVPIIGMSTTLWRGIHPGGIIFEGGLAPPMLQTLLVSLAAFTVLYVLMMVLRVTVKNNEITIEKLKTLR